MSEAICRRLPSSLGMLAIAGMCAASLATGQARAQTVFSSAGGAADITSSVTGFRTSLGALNPNFAGSVGSGRREINWDGVPDMFVAPNALPGNFFNVSSPRGVLLSTPGSSLQVSANGLTGTPADFGNIDPAYPEFFAPFSPQRLFTAIGSNVVDVSFFVAGSSQGALSRGFGVVFSDVDVANTTSLSFFGATSNLLGTYFAEASGFQERFSFLGVDYGAASVSRVRITSGNQPLAPGNGNLDTVAMDDFIYGEPVAAVVPEPETYALMLAGLAALAWRRRRRCAAAS